VFQDRDGSAVTLGDAVHVHQGTVIQTGEGGSVDIGAETHIQPRCQFSAYKGAIRIGARVEIAPNCAFYPYNHEIRAGLPVRSQPLRSKGGIVVGDDAWLGYGVIVLDGARIGEGAVIGAGSVVTGDIPAGAVAVGAPARVTRMRD
jgi:acetyltransferase-like isoleucine patch superfamily enzyme